MSEVKNSAVAAKISITDLTFRYFDKFSCAFPRNRFNVVTGPSGSGKSTLLFDILAAESRRRIATILGESCDYQPRADIKGLPFAVECTAVRRRSKHATVASEIGLYGQLRHYFLSVGVASCIDCGTELQSWSIHRLLSYLESESFAGVAELHISIALLQAEVAAEVVAEAGRAGFNRIFLNGERTLVEELLPSLDQCEGKLSILIDSFRIVDGSSSRITEGYDTAAIWLERWKGSSIELEVTLSGDSGLKKTVVIGSEYRCSHCGALQCEMNVDLFNYTVGQGRCHGCGGLGFSSRGRRCDVCDGLRVSAEALALRVGATTVRQLLSMDLFALESWSRLDPVRADIHENLGAALRVGLGYLEPMRGLATLSSGELQRVQLLRHSAQKSSGMVYLLDEPGSSLHPDDMPGVIAQLITIRDRSNTIIATEHGPQVIAKCDHLLELGPGGGELGGQVVYHGSPANWLSGTARNEVTTELQPKQIEHSIPIQLDHISIYNLKDLSVQIPIARLTAMVGVSGSGKSTLLFEGVAPAAKRALRARRLRRSKSSEERELSLGISGLEAIDRIVVLKDLLHRGRLRSVVAASMGALAGLQDIYAKVPYALAFGFGPSDFSPRSIKTRCGACRGTGVLSTADEVCPICRGKLFNSEVDRIKIYGLSIGELMLKTVHEVHTLFSRVPDVAAPLSRAVQLGLGYLRLGQPSSTLAAGEEQRLRLAALTDQDIQRCLILLDEPSRGLSKAESCLLVKYLRLLVENGNTVVVVEHNLDLIREVDHVIELGPGAGPDGGTILATGEVAKIASDSNSRIARYLK